MVSVVGETRKRFVMGSLILTKNERWWTKASPMATTQYHKDEDDDHDAISPLRGESGY